MNGSNVLLAAQPSTTADDPLQRWLAAQRAKNGLAASPMTPWTQSLPMAIQQWQRGSLTPAQQQMYQGAFGAQYGALGNEMYLRGQTQTPGANPNWAENYPGF